MPDPAPPPQIERLRELLRSLAQAVIDDVSNSESIVSLDTEHQARLALEEVMPDA